MRILSLADNLCNPISDKHEIQAEHGLSLLVEDVCGRNILFDMGQGKLFAENAKAMNANLADVDIAVLSHGHYDHGGGLETFLNINSKACVYVNKHAFRPHFSMKEHGLKYIGLDRTLADNGRLEYCNGVTVILNEEHGNITLFSDVCTSVCYPPGNRLLYASVENYSGEDAVNDSFAHEQSMIIRQEDKTVLLAGCAHCGIVNIIRKAEEICGCAPTHVFAGMHLMKNGMDDNEENLFIRSLAEELMKYNNTRFFTMHCTGNEQYQKLRNIMGRQIGYMYCGDSIII